MYMYMYMHIVPSPPRPDRPLRPFRGFGIQALLRAGLNHSTENKNITKTTKIRRECRNRIDICVSLCWSVFVWLQALSLRPKNKKNKDPKRMPEVFCALAFCDFGVFCFVLVFGSLVFCLCSKNPKNPNTKESTTTLKKHKNKEPQHQKHKITTKHNISGCLFFVVVLVLVSSLTFGAARLRACRRSPYQSPKPQTLYRSIFTVLVKILLLVYVRLIYKFLQIILLSNSLVPVDVSEQISSFSSCAYTCPHVPPGLLSLTQDEQLQQKFQS